VTPTSNHNPDRIGEFPTTASSINRVISTTKQLVGVVITRRKNSRRQTSCSAVTATLVHRSPDLCVGLNGFIAPLRRFLPVIPPRPELRLATTSPTSVFRAHLRASDCTASEREATAASWAPGSCKLQHHRTADDRIESLGAEQVTMSPGSAEMSVRSDRASKPSIASLCSAGGGRSELENGIDPNLNESKAVALLTG